ncbi:MAG: MoaD/ThiS family protein [Anaerolineae bacterium]|nr:MoaD/ThiS family protein [Anaerolineae bacterium]
MQIDVRVFATLRRYVPELGVGETIKMDVESGTTLVEILDHLNLPREEVKIVMRNGRQADLDDAVQEGDRIAFVPAIAGG